MFEIIDELSEPIQGRYETLVRNIKSASNSFYDSYIDLLEEIGKDVAARNGVDVDGKTAGYIFRNREFLEKAGIEVPILEKINDYILKINKHKHRKEKEVSLESVISYMRALHDLLIPYAAMVTEKPVKEDFFEKEIAHLFGLSERENDSLKKEVVALKEELGKMEKFKEISRSTMDQCDDIDAALKGGKLSLEEQNDMLRTQIILLKDMKLEILEAKLDKANEALIRLEEYLVDSRAVSLAALTTIVGDRKDVYIEKAKEELANGRK